MVGVGALDDPFGNRGFVPSGTPVPMVIDQIKNTDYSRRGAPWCSRFLIIKTHFREEQAPLPHKNKP